MRDVPEVARCRASLHHWQPTRACFTGEESCKYICERSSPQLHTPIRLIEELLPGLVLGVAKAQGDEWVALGAFGFADEFDAGLFGRAATFAGVALDAGADEILPRFFAAE